jgi:hypothetical protein
MAVITDNFLNYFISIYNMSVSLPAYFSDPILHLAEICCDKNNNETVECFKQGFEFDNTIILLAKEAYKKIGLVGIVQVYFENNIVEHFTNIEVERKVLALKTGFQNLPATKMATIINGFGHKLKTEEIRKIYSSYGLTNQLKELKKSINFIDINLRTDKLSELIKKSVADEETQKVQKLYKAMRNYLLAPQQEKKNAIKKSEIGHGLFYKYWETFNIYGMLGLIDKGKEVYRQTKIGMFYEAKIVIDKLQNPKRSDGYYMTFLASRNIKINRSAIAKIFARWNITNYNSKFVSNINRLEQLPAYEIEPELEKEFKEKTFDKNYERYVEINFLYNLCSLKKYSLTIIAPGLFVLWYYLEKLKIFPFLNNLGLTKSNKGYCWFEHLLLNIGRIFYGISSYSKTCKIVEPTLPLFSQLYALPCNDTFIDGLGTITETEAFKFQQWIIYRLKELQIIKGVNIGFDFHQIDKDVEMDKIRNFGSGYSPKKKICVNGFRPHIAWDIDTGTVIVLEFRKSSARGTKTFERFVKDYILQIFKDIVENVYIDSEYTGKAVWDFILKPEKGMNANLVGCLKQNPLVRGFRDKFLIENEKNENFWNNYDAEHIYSSKTFTINWNYECPETKKIKEFELYCVVKKNIKNGNLRCFGTSKKGLTAIEILNDYSKRWIIENGIKDLIISYFLDDCPGTNPHHVNVHFFTVSLCKQIYRMMQEDLGDYIKNADGSIKSLDTMREFLIKQGAASVRLNDDTIEIHFLNSFKVVENNHLNKFYNFINEKCKNGLNILGGLKLKYFLKIPYGEEYANSFKKDVINPAKISDCDKN